MIDFTPIIERKINWTRFAAQFDKQDLYDQAIWMFNTIENLIADATDEDVVFTPTDPDAYDDYAETPEEVEMSWNLGHVIVHLTASAEESAFLAAELARGVKMDFRRSRFETPWQTVTTIQQCRARLAESRRMVMASLDIWPDNPHLENFYKTSKGLKVTPLVRFLFGQEHAASHLDQIKDILNQSQTAREMA
jgi:hypothetical protein